jgi:hypothetical protein
MMKLAAYKAWAPGTGLISKLIALRHLGRYSHVELVFSDGVCYSSSAQDGGVRFRRIRLNPRRWDTFDLPWVTPEHEVRMRAWGLGRVDRCYDWHGVLRFVLPWLRQRPDEQFCSEECLTMLRTQGYLTHVAPSTVWPSRLVKIIKAYTLGLGY